MIISAESPSEFRRCIDEGCSAERSIVLRYMHAVKFGGSEPEDSAFRDELSRTSIHEGVRAFQLFRYRGVELHILDETSLMYTKSLKSIDGCVSIAACIQEGCGRVVFESGGNTGMALSEYGRRAGMETFFFCPEENIPLLNSTTFEGERTHLISVERPGAVKEAARLFAEANGLKRIPEPRWRNCASMFRGLFVLERMLDGFRPDWMVQTVSAAFGPIGMYRVFKTFRHETGGMPRFLGVQQEVNAPLYRYWKNGPDADCPTEVASTGRLLSRIMYDADPKSYGTFADFKHLLEEVRGDMTTVSHAQFSDFMVKKFNGKSALQALEENGMAISTIQGEIVDRTGLVALAGALKEIDAGTIAAGSRVACCLTGGGSDADGRAEPELRISKTEGLERVISQYSRRVFGK